MPPAFVTILAEIAASERASSASGPSASADPMRRATAPITDCRPEAHGRSATDFVMLEDPDIADGDQETPKLDELMPQFALRDDMSVADLNSLRRNFLRLYHPDKRPDLPGATATRLVASVNALIDREIQRRTGR